MEYNKPWIFIELIPFIGLGIIGVSKMCHFIRSVLGGVRNRYQIIIEKNYIPISNKKHNFQFELAYLLNTN